MMMPRTNNLGGADNGAGGGIGDSIGGAIRGSVPFVGDSIANLLGFTTASTTQRSDPSYGTERQALLSGNGYDQMLVLLRPPPTRRPFGGLLTQFIDIDYETFIVLLGLAGAVAGYALNQVVINFHAYFSVLVRKRGYVPRNQLNCYYLHR